VWSVETVRAGDQPALRGAGGFFAGGSRLNGEAMTAAGFFGALGFLISRLLRLTLGHARFSFASGDLPLPLGQGDGYGGALVRRVIDVV
jgi:hypothetical protein